ncbi:MAG: hypothetical protein KJO32_06840, partial [Deltaproteobacteria bacterium]|nr:hypothetical protein [Deltaproteobacteria bacterium]
MLKFLSSEYQLYACGKKFSHALTLNENRHFAKDSGDRQFRLNYAVAYHVSCEISFAVLAGKTQLAAGIDPASSTEAE